VSKKTVPLATVRSAARIVKPTAAAESYGDGTALPEDAIRIGAYLRWDAAGRPGGDGVHFWLEAEKELRQGK